MELCRSFVRRRVPEPSTVPVAPLSNGNSPSSSHYWSVWRIGSDITDPVGVVFPEMLSSDDVAHSCWRRFSREEMNDGSTAFRPIVAIVLKQWQGARCAWFAPGTLAKSSLRHTMPGPLKKLWFLDCSDSGRKRAKLQASSRSDGHFLLRESSASAGVSLSALVNSSRYKANKVTSL